MPRLAYVLPLVLLLSLLTPFDGARAEEEEEGDEIKQMEAALLGMTEFVGKTRLTEDGAKLLIEHMPSFEAIGEVVGTSKNTVKSRLRYALEKIRNGLVERSLLADPSEKPS